MTTTKDGIACNWCKYVIIQRCKIDEVTNSLVGIVATASNVNLEDCDISNKSIAIKAMYNSNIISNNVTGSGNTYGLCSYNNSNIGKESTQPSGTTQEFAMSGGVIR